VHQLSLEAYRAERNKLGSRALMIFKWLKDHGEATDRQIQNALGFKDGNCVKPRISELKKMGLIVESGETIDELTGKRVRKVCVA
jgi:predicted HTH transcriptional regulator